ncbi:MAG: Pyruvate/proton symporter BtsT [Gammaproteobacteria bacterium]|nr:Pyruvate/proton symporter BtsT [Gammaproteobacteria bacterium]
MHPFILILLALAIWVLGYRFYGKFLKIGILQLHEDWPASALSQPGDPDSEPRGSWTVSAFHAAASTGLLSVIGAAIAVIWGWVPAFLWVTLGSIIAATVLNLGVMWATLRRSGESLAGLAYELGGLPAALSLFFSGVLLLVLVSSTLGMMLGNLLHAHPETTWPFLSLLVIGGLLKHGIRTSPLRAGASAVILIAAFFVGQSFPLSLGGNWSFSIRSVQVFGLRHELIWAVIALYMAYRAACVRASEGTYGRSIVATLLAIAVLGLFIAGTAIQGNPMDAPQFHTVDNLPPVPILLFLVVTGGALSGMHALVASGCTARNLQKQRDILPVGFLGVGLDSLVAVMVIVALVTGFTDRESWETVYGTWPVYGGLYIWVDLAITKIALAISAVGIPLAWSVGLVAALVTALALSMLETGLRILGSSVGEFVEDFDFKWVNTPVFKQRFAVTLIGLGTLMLSQTHINLQHWLLVGIANQWFACSVLVLLGLMLWRTRRSALFCWAPLVVIGPLTIWGTTWIMLQWLQRMDWVLFGIGAAVCLFGVTYFGLCAGSAVRLRRQMVESPNVVPRF